MAPGVETMVSFLLLALMIEMGISDRFPSIVKSLGQTE
jgi:hypothetical protein